MFKRLFSSLALVATVALYGCGGGGGGGGGGGTLFTLGSVNVSPANPASITVDDTQQFTATGLSTTGLVMDLPSPVTWQTSDPLVATIDATGKVTAKKVGTTNITATAGGIVSTPITVTVAARLTVSTIAGLSGTSGSAVAGPVIGSDARFKFPNGITTTDGINLYVADTENHAIRKIDVSTIPAQVTTFATLPPGPPPSALPAELYGITKVGDTLYVTDGFNHVVYKIDSLGAVTTFAGVLGTSGSVDGIGTAAKFNQPQDITTDGTNLYVADYLNGSIRKIVISSQNVTTVANIDHPWGITTDGASLYVTDPLNFIVRKIDILAASATPWPSIIFAGSPFVPGSADGTTTALFIGPHGITTDGNNIYVADYNSTTGSIRKIEILTGTVATVYTKNAILPLGITLFGTTLYTSNNDHTITNFFGGLIN